MGRDFGAVMTIIRMSSGGLFIHSPFPPNEILERQITGLGPVEVVISPNNFYPRDLEDFLERVPGCQFFCPERSGQRSKVFRRASVTIRHLSPFGTTPWDADLEHLQISGMPFVDEYVFYHKASNTLIASNLISHPASSARKSARIINYILGLNDKNPGQTRLFRSCIRDKAEYNLAVGRLQEWDFDKVVVSHGRIIEDRATTLVPRLLR